MIWWSVSSKFHVIFIFIYFEKKKAESENLFLYRWTFTVNTCGVTAVHTLLKKAEQVLKTGSPHQTDSGRPGGLQVIKKRRRRKDFSLLSKQRLHFSQPVNTSSENNYISTNPVNPFELFSNRFSTRPSRFHCITWHSLVLLTNDT